MMFQLDEHPQIRDVSFPLLVHLLENISVFQTVSYSDVVEKPFDTFTGVWRTSEGIMSRTRRYFHLNALKVLGLVDQKDKVYSVSSSGNRILDANKGSTDLSLNEETISLLRQAVLGSSYIQENFLTLFVGIPYKDPTKWGQPISINPIPGKRTYSLKSSIWSGELVLSVLQTQGFIWGLKQWCQYLSVTDEIFIRPQGDVTEDRVNIIFPIDVAKSQSISVLQFHEILKKYLPFGKPVYKDTLSISVPLLLYKLCPGEHIPLDKAKELLLAWITENKEAAFIESTSLPVLQSGRYKRGSSNASWRKQEDTFLLVNGKYYSRLFVSESLWG